MEQKKISSTTADHLANERTLLAWVRTAIGIIAFGFVLVKTPAMMQPGEAAPSLTNYYTVMAGLVMILLASLSLLFAYIGYARTKKQLESGNYQHSSALLLTLVMFLFATGILLSFLLLKDVF